MRTVAETEEIGVETILELKNNREKIDSARTKVDDFSCHSFHLILIMSVLSCVELCVICAQGQEFSAVADDADKRLKSMWFRHKTWGLFG